MKPYIMKKINVLLLLCLLLVGINSTAQNVYEWYQDGIVVFQLKTTTNYTIPSRDKHVDIKQVDFISSIQNQYGIYEMTQLHPNDKDELLRRTYQIKFNAVDKVDAIIRDIAQIPVIEYAEKKELHGHFLTPNDLGANTTTGTGMWHLYRMNAQQAWDLSTGSANVVVAVADDAILSTHQDLTNKLVTGYDAPTGGSNTNPCGSNDGNHGTHVSGTVGAQTNNGIGVASIGFNVSVMPVKIGNCNGQLTHGYEGINWAANNGADVINMSWGGGGFSNYGQNVCNAAFNAGSILVAAAGNDGTNQQFYPAAYNNVIAVASTTTNDAKSGFSQYGTWITVSAPGSAIRSTWATSNTAYSRIQGTSMASPNVAGLVGLMKSYVPTVSNTNIINCLLSSAANINAANPSYIGQLGTGRIDAFAALQCMGLYNVNVDAGISAINSPSSTVCGASFTPQVTLRNFGANTLTSVTINYEWNGNPQTFNWTGSLTTGQTTLITLPVQSGGAGSYTFTASTSNPNNTTDENPGNNSSSISFVMDPNGQVVDLTLITDCYGDEITWNITNEDGLQVTTGGPYANITGGATNNYALCLPVGCYTFNIIDTYGDGMYGSQWQNCSVNGNYYMTDEGGATLFQMTAANADFGYGTSHNFCVIAPNVFNDAGVAQIASPSGLVCSSTINPEVELRNFGLNALTSADINYQTSGGLQTFSWTGNLASGQSTNVVLPAIGVTSGSITITAYTSSPNGVADDNSANDQSQKALMVYSGAGLPLPFTETFENSPFTTNWTIDNPDNETTWEVVTVSGTAPGNKAAKMDFFNYAQASRRDGMISPKLNLAGYSSVDLTFEHAYRRFNQTATDSLIVYVSADCGNTYNRVFARGENGTGTFATATTTTVAFNPANSGEWCMGTVGSDCYSVNLDSYIGQQVLIKFEGFNAGTVGNNLYIDNINVIGIPANNTPTPSFTENSQIICEGGSVAFTDQSTANITGWNWSFPGGSPTTSTSQNPTVTYPSAGNYDVTLEVTNAFGTETITVTNHITVNTPPNVTISSPSTTICEGSSTNLVASGANSYTWDNGLGSGPSKTVSPTTTTTYEVTGSAGQGCTNTQSITITVIPQPNVSSSATETSICNGNNTTISASGADTYSWNNGLGAGAIHSVSPTQTTTYTVTGTVGTCTNTSSITVTVIEEAELQVNAGSLSICEGEGTTISANGGTDYTWNPPLGLSSTTGSPVTASPTVTTTYTVEGNTTCGPATANITITVTEAPPTPIIYQQGNVLSTTVSGGSSVQWYLNGSPIAGATSANYTISENGTYTVVITNGNGCSSSSAATNAELDTSGLEENNLGFGYLLFPNPTHGEFKLTVYGLTEAVNFKIYDVLGKEINLNKETSISSNSTLNFDLTGYSEGVYFISFSTIKGTIIEKIVLQK